MPKPETINTQRRDPSLQGGQVFRGVNVLACPGLTMAHRIPKCRQFANVPKPAQQNKKRWPAKERQLKHQSPAKQVANHSRPNTGGESITQGPDRSRLVIRILTVLVSSPNDGAQNTHPSNPEPRHAFCDPARPSGGSPAGTSPAPSTTCRGCRVQLQSNSKYSGPRPYAPVSPIPLPGIHWSVAGAGTNKNKPNDLGRKRA